MKQLLKGDKKYFRVHEVKYIDMPNWPELKIAELIKLVKDDKEVASYLKDNYQEGKGHSATFLANIINSVYPGLL